MECKVVYVEDLETPYTIKYAMVEPMKFKRYDRTQKKNEDKRLIEEWEVEK